MRLSLTGFLVACLAGAAPPPAAAQPDPPDLNKLTALAARHRLPAPPKDARLVLAHNNQWHQFQIPPAGRSAPVYAPAFLLEQRPDGDVIVLRGTERLTLSVRRAEPAWRAFSLDHVAATPGGYGTNFGYDATLVCAVQVAARGDAATARSLLDRFARGAPDRLRDARLILAEAAYAYHRGRLRDGPGQWRDARDRMVALFDEFPELETPERLELLGDLRTALEAPPPRLGSVEAVVLDWAGRPSDSASIGLFPPGPMSDADGPARRLVLRGFGAVPDLIDLLDDSRMTAREWPGFNNTPARVVRVGELAEFLLREIAGAGAPSGGDDGPDSAAWRAWWAAARRRPEREYFAAAVLDTTDGRVTRVHESAARIVADRWPSDLPGLCERYTAQADAGAPPYGLADALAAANLPVGDRVSALAAFAGRGPLPHRRWVLAVLADLDRGRAAAILCPLLDRLTRDFDGEYWNCDEQYFAGVVVAVDDPGVWREYLRVVRGSSVGLRMQVLHRLADQNLGAQTRGTRMAFLAAFLNDEAVRDRTANPRQFGGPCAAADTPRIAVRDFAADCLAEVLGLDDAPNETWGAGRWAAFRENVRGRLAAEKLPDLDAGQ